MADISDQFGDIPWRWVSSEDFELARQYMYELLDGGADTIILASSAPIFSHHEEFNGTFIHAMHYIEEWEAEHVKEIKVVMMPQLGEFPVLRQAFTDILVDRLDTVPSGSCVKC